MVAERIAITDAGRRALEHAERLEAVTRALRECADLIPLYCRDGKSGLAQQMVRELADELESIIRDDDD